MRDKESGNILFLVLLAIVLLGMAIAFLSSGNPRTKETLDRQSMDSQISQMFDHTSVLASAIMQMTMEGGVDTDKIYQNISVLKPGESGFDTGSNKYKIYHPHGGGVSYMSASATDVDKAIATKYNISPNSIITGVGPTDDTIGDVVFTARIISAEYCAHINKRISGSEDVPAMSSDTFSTMFNDGNAVVINSANCSGCVNKAKLCVTNGDSNAWGFYSVLYPG